MNNERAAQQASDRYESEDYTLKRLEYVACQIVDELMRLEAPCPDQVSDTINEMIGSFNLSSSEEDVVRNLIKDHLY